MKPERVRELLAEARARPRDERADFLAGACGSDLETRAEVESLLNARDAMGDFLEEPAAERLLPAEAPLEPGRRVAAFTVRHKIGAGGAGTVYEAEQASPKRRVALKILRRSGAGEADFLARLQHPGIAHVYEAGVHDGSAYVALELIEGARDLETFAREERLGGRGIAALLASVCDAVQHGHQKGVIHQDLKPGNVLVDGGGRPKVIDFGIARARDATEPSVLRGTVPYVSPERCAGADDADARGDVYSLGVILYQLLAGGLPHDIEGRSLSEALRAVRDDEPQPLPRRVAADLRAIVGRAIARDPDRRYASAAALADDLRRFLSHRPVEARDGTAWYHARRFMRRERLATLLGVTVLGVVVVAAVVNRRLALDREQERRAAERQAYVANIAAASAALRARDVAEARRRLDLAPAGLRGWEWRHLQARLDRSVATFVWPGHRISAAATSEKRVAAAGLSGIGYALRLWEIETGAARTLPLATWGGALAFDPAGERLAVGSMDGRIEIRGAADGVVRAEWKRHDGPVNDVRFLPDGARFVTASTDRTVRLWSMDGTSRLLSRHADRAIGLAVSRSGRHLYIGDRGGRVRVWDLEEDRQLLDWQAHTESVESLAVDGEETRLVSVSRDHTVRVWNPATGEPIAVRHAHASNVRWVDFHPDGELFATASWDRTIRLWRAHDAVEVGVLGGHGGQVNRVHFTADGRLVSSGSEGTVKLWDPRRWEDVPTLRGHRDRVVGVAFHPDGRMASASRDGTVRVWDPASKSGRVVSDTPGWNGSIAFVDGGRRLAATGNGFLHEWKTADWQLIRRERGIGLFDAAPGADRLSVAAGRSAWEWDGVEGHLAPRAAIDGIVCAVAREPATGRTAVGTTGGFVQVVGGGRARIGTRRIEDLAWSPRGASLCAASGHELTLLDAGTLRVRAVLRGHAGTVNALAASPDGTRIASVSDDTTVRLWDARTGEEVVVLYGHRLPVLSVAFSRDGTRIATGSGVIEGRDSVIKIWEAPR